MFYGKTETSFDEQGLISGLDGLESSSFSFGLYSKKGFGKYDSFGFQIDQSLRLEEGKMDLSIPVGRTKLITESSFLSVVVTALLFIFFSQ